MKKLLVGAAVAGTLLVGNAGSVSAAFAAQPAVPGCLGASVSAGAHALHPYGQAVLVPNTPRGPFGKVSDAVHAIQAGQVPDAVYPNSCNLDQ